MGSELVEEKIRTLKEFPAPLAVHLKHLLLSHHGQYDYGSPKRPKTLEAVVLNFLDDLDSKINGIRRHIDNEPENESSWTGYHRQYDRYFFKGQTALQSASSEGEATQERKSPKDTNRPGQKDSSRSRFSNTLADQLKGKALNLAAEKKKDEHNG